MIKSWLIIKLFYRLRSYLFTVESLKIKSELNLNSNFKYRDDLLRTLQPIAASVKNCTTFIDIGSNEGDFSKIFADVYKPASLICIEPNGALNSAIRKNTADYKISIINKAISREEGESDFYFHEETQMSSLFKSNEELIKRDFSYDDTEKIRKDTVAVTTLDAIFKEYGDKINPGSVFLKIDTQGNELDVLKGGKNALKQIQFCLLEYMFQTPYEKQYSFGELVNLMEENAFTCLGPVHSSYRTTGEVGAVLFLFEKKLRE